MNKRSILSNIVWSVISLVISTAITMLILPYVSKEIGIEAYGYISLCNNLVTYVDLISSTINIYAIRYISIEYHKGNIKKANEFYNSVLIADVIIAIVLIIPCTFCIFYINSIFDVPAILTTDIRILFALTLVNYIITLLGTVFASTAFIKDILYKDTMIKAEGNIMKGLLLVVLFTLLFPRVWYVTIASVISSMYVILRNFKLTKRYTPEFRINIKQFSGKAIKEVAGQGIWNTVASLGTAMNSGLDLLVTNFYLGAIKMGQLSVPKTLSNFITILLTAVTNSFRPQLLNFYTQGEQDKLNEGFQMSMKSCGLVTCTIFSVFTALGFQFLNLWLPNENTRLIYNLTVLTFLAETFTGFVKPLHYGFVLTGRLKLPCITNLLVGLFNVVSMILFLNFTSGGLYVVTMTTVIGNITFNFIFMPFYAAKVIKVSKKSIYATIGKYFVSTGGITLVLIFLFKGVIIINWMTLLLYIATGTLISSIAYMLLMLNRSEKDGLYNMIKQKFPN